MTPKKQHLLSGFKTLANNLLLPIAGATLSLALIPTRAAHAQSPVPVGPPQSPSPVCASGGLDACVTSLYSFPNPSDPTSPVSGSFPASGVMPLPNGGYILPIAGIGNSPFGTGSIGVVAGLYPATGNTLQEYNLGTFAPAGAAPSVPLVNDPGSPYKFTGGTWYGGTCGWGSVYWITVPAKPDGTGAFVSPYSDFSNSLGQYYTGSPTPPPGGNPNEVCGNNNSLGYENGLMPAALLPLQGTTTLLGTMQLGGEYSSGTLARFVPNGQEGYTLKVDYTFDPNSTEFNGNIPGPLVQADAKTVYGITLSGGDPNYPVGTLYKVTKSSSGAWDNVIMAYSFPNEYGIGINGIEPIGLSMGPDGNVYVATFTGGAYAGGTIGRYIPATNTYEKLLDMGKTQSDLSFPLTPPLVVADKSGKLHIFFTGSNGGDLNSNYGYGSGGVGVIPEVNKQVTLWQFRNGADGAYPSGPILFNPQNGTAVITLPGGGDLGGGAVTSIPLPMGSSTVFNELKPKQMTSATSVSTQRPSREPPHYDPTLRYDSKLRSLIPN
jgi:hypothetical protein